MNVYDLIIIGAGPGGMTAAIYASRSKLNTLIIEADAPGGQMLKTSHIANYPGYEMIDGADLSYKMFSQVKKLNVPFVFERVTKLTFENDLKVVATDKNTYYAKYVIIATGSSYIRANVLNEAKFLGHGVSYCSICDGHLFEGKTIAVLGGGDSALKEAMYLSSFASHIYLIHRRHEFRGDLKNQEDVKNNPKIEIVTPYVAKEIVGDDVVTGLIIKNNQDETEKELKLDGVFPFLGNAPTTDFVHDYQIFNERGFIIVDQNYETKLSGVFAVGDVTNNYLKQIVTATSDGAIAASVIVERLKNN